MLILLKTNGLEKLVPLFFLFYLCSMKITNNCNKMPTQNAKNREIIGDTYKKVANDLFAIFRQARIPEDICEDLVQDVFVKLLGLDLIVEGQVKALAVKIAYQKRTDYLRHRSYVEKARHAGDGLMEQSYMNTDAEVNDILKVEMKVLRRMSALDCKVYSMIRFEEKTADEIAETLCLTKRAVEGRLYRSRVQIRENIRKVMNF